MVRNFATGGAAISVLARELGAQLDVVNLGTVNDPGDIPGVRRAIVAPSTANFCLRPAMNEAQLAQALAAGRASVDASRGRRHAVVHWRRNGDRQHHRGYRARVRAAGCEPRALAGAGTGLDAAGIAHKSRRDRARPGAAWPGTWPAVSSCAAWAVSRSPRWRAPTWPRRRPDCRCWSTDSSAPSAALAAVRINPGVRDWLLFSHRSHEHGHAARPASARCAGIARHRHAPGRGQRRGGRVPLLRLACALHGEMATFAQAGVSTSDAQTV